MEELVHPGVAGEGRRTEIVGGHCWRIHGRKLREEFQIFAKFPLSSLTPMKG